MNFIGYSIKSRLGVNQAFQTMHRANEENIIKSFISVSIFIIRGDDGLKNMH